MKKNGRKIIGLVISLVLIILLSHPAWLPLPASTKDALAKVLTQNFSMSHEAGISFARILGVVLNKVDKSEKSYGYYKYGKSYGYHYGYGE